MTDFTRPEPERVDPKVLTVIDVLDPLSDMPINRDQLAALLDQYEDLNVVSEAISLAAWCEANNTRLQIPLNRFRHWMDRSRRYAAEAVDKAAARARPREAPDPSSASESQRRVWMRENIQSFVERVTFAQESYGSWEREQNEATGEYQTRLQPTRRAKIRGQIIAKRLSEGQRWTYAWPEEDHLPVPSVESATAEYEQAERERLQLPKEGE